VSIAQAVLTTERLTLRPVDPMFALPMLAFQLKNRDHFAPWDPIPGALYFTSAYWSARFKLRARDWLDGRGASYLLFSRTEPELLIGSISLSNIQRGVMQSCTMGYGLGRDYQGQGLMREALDAMVQLAFSHLKLHRIQANYQPHNQRSATLLAHAGFVIEGHARQYLFLDGAWRDHVMTALINHDYNPADVLL